MGSRWAKAALVVAAVVVALVIGSQWPTTAPSGSDRSAPTGSVTTHPTSPSSTTSPTPSAPGTRSAAHATPSQGRATTGATSPREARPRHTPMADPPAPSPTTSPESARPASARARAAFARMSLEQRVGQLFMVGTPATGADASIAHDIADLHVGNVILTGRSSLGVDATSRVTKDLQARATHRATAGVPLLVSVDQEGGAVQVLSGPGFSRMPSAVTQGGWSPRELRSQARVWGGQLAAAGVTVNLAPVIDTVPAGTSRSNAPIGAFGRQFGSDPGAVWSHGQAFAGGMAAAGVAPTVKHFPGLGRVTGNTDTTAGVTDHATTTSEVTGGPFASAVAQRAPIVMVSTAVYDRIDPDHPAAFSRRVVTGLLRDRLGYGGVVISDDLGAAQQVAAWSPGERATQFIGAGGDLVLTVGGPVVDPMVSAVVDKARSDPAFRAKVNAAALRVLELKHAQGLLTR